MLLWPVGLLKMMLCLFLKIQGTDLYLDDFIENNCNTGLFSDAYVQISNMDDAKYDKALQFDRTLTCTDAVRFMGLRES